MAINFYEIPNEVLINRPDEESTVKVPERTVLEEINARQKLIENRTIKCKDIKPLYEHSPKKSHQYSYKYNCVCPVYRPKYPCQHIGNTIINRDVLSPKEHLIYLATPKCNIGALRKMPSFYIKKSILPNCTARIYSLALPDKKNVRYALQNYKNIIPRRNVQSLKAHLQDRPSIEYTDIETAIEWMTEENRLRKVAKHLERKRCKKLKNKILKKQRMQIKKIVRVLFEEMKEFLLNDQFLMDENSSLVEVIIDALKDFTDKEVQISSNLKEYQKILASNLAVWINKFISNLNIHVDEENPRKELDEKNCTQNLDCFLPVEDYISCSTISADIYNDDPDNAEILKAGPHKITRLSRSAPREKIAQERSRGGGGGGEGEGSSIEISSCLINDFNEQTYKMKLTNQYSDDDGDLDYEKEFSKCMDLPLTC